MRIKPVFFSGGEIPKGATLTIDDEDAERLAEIVSYARDLAASDDPKMRRLVQQLAAVAEVLNGDADAHLDTRGAEYKKTRALFVKQ